MREGCMDIDLYRCTNNIIKLYK